MYYASAASEQTSRGQGCFDNYYLNMEPSLSLAIRNNNPIINKGDTIHIEIFISGYGHSANITKIYATLPIGLVDDNTIFGNGYYVDYNYTDKNWTKQSFPLTPGYAHSFYIYLPGNYFQQDPTETNNCPQVYLFTEEEFNISGEWIAPIGININTSKKASDGENKLFFILTYSDGKKWYQDKQEVSVHINSWQEENNTVYTILIGFIGAGLVAAASFIWHSVGIKVKPLPEGTTNENKGTQSKRIEFQ